MPHFGQKQGLDQNRSFLKHFLKLIFPDGRDQNFLCQNTRDLAQSLRAEVKSKDSGTR